MKDNREKVDTKTAYRNIGLLHEKCMVLNTLNELSTLFKTS